MRHFVLVTVTRSAPTLSDVTGAGIRKLKRGVDLDSFIEQYMSQFDVLNREDFVRGDTKVVVSRGNDSIMQWSFTEYREEDLLHAVRHLTREELLRDLKELLPLKDIQR